MEFFVGFGHKNITIFSNVCGHNKTFTPSGVSALQPCNGGNNDDCNLWGGISPSTEKYPGILCRLLKDQIELSLQIGVNYVCSFL